MAVIMGQQSVQLTVRERTKMGRRKSNQDAALLAEVASGRVYLVGVADGMGGYAGGEQASAAARRHVMRFAETLNFDESASDRDILRHIRSCIPRLYEEIQQDIQSIAASDPNLSQMGTTLVLAAVSGRQFFVANIGDSRAYFLYKNSSGEDAFRQVTEDHTVANDARRANQPISLDTPEAQKLGKALTRALRPNTPSTPEIWPPDAESVAYQASDGCALLISSDGMYGSVEENHIAQILIESPTLDAALERLEDQAYANESTDNITTVAVDFGPRDPRRRSTIRPLTPPPVPVRPADIVGGPPIPAGVSTGEDGRVNAGQRPATTPEPRRENASHINPIMLIGGGVFAVGAAIVGFILFKPGAPSVRATPTPTAPTASPAESPEPTPTATASVGAIIKPVATKPHPMTSAAGGPVNATVKGNGGDDTPGPQIESTERPSKPRVMPSVKPAPRLPRTGAPKPAATPKRNGDLGSEVDAVGAVAGGGPEEGGDRAARTPHGTPHPDITVSKPAARPKPQPSARPTPRDQGVKNNAQLD